MSVSDIVAVAVLTKKRLMHFPSMVSSSVSRSGFKGSVVTTLRPMHVVRAVLLALFAASQLVSATIHVQCGSAGQNIAALLPQEALHSRPHTLAPQNSDSEASLPTCMKWFTASFVDALIEGVKASGGLSFTVEEERNGALVSVRKVV
jgi:hypothetical protein